MTTHESAPKVTTAELLDNAAILRAKAETMIQAIEDKKTDLALRFHEGEIKLGEFEDRMEWYDYRIACIEGEYTNMIDDMSDQHHKPTLSKRIGRAVHNALFV